MLQSPSEWIQMFSLPERRVFCGKKTPISSSSMSVPEVNAITVWLWQWVSFFFLAIWQKPIESIREWNVQLRIQLSISIKILKWPTTVILLALSTTSDKKLFNKHTAEYMELFFTPLLSYLMKYCNTWVSYSHHAFFSASTMSYLKIDVNRGWSWLKTTEVFSVNTCENLKTSLLFNWVFWLISRRIFNRNLEKFTVVWMVMEFFELSVK